ncbi:Smr domain-containing protein [Mycena chlorophos]|uniref:Smr domain-containing protein n=1 Tax=Mycena chlorophos TaxID=658473 RepID=A0A8H6RXT0_MYCCL|nr:Smr domain-containing protein [Mycena chlorophos]
MEQTTFEIFQKEFCPPLDSSLLAAMLADIDPTPAALAELRKNLLLLAEQADSEAAQYAALDDLEFDFSASSDTSLRDFCTTTTTTTSSADSTSFNSPLGFLMATMPHIPELRLRQALADPNAEELDMWEIVERLFPYFHSPQHASTPYNALCAALTALSSPIKEGEHTATLFNLLDLLLPSYDDLDEDGRTRLFGDIELALAAAQGRGEDAFELVKVLRDLDFDAAEGHYEMGVYHSPVTQVKFSQKLRTSTLPDGPAPTPPPPPKLARATTAPVASTSGNKPSPYQWQAVHPRRRITQKRRTVPACDDIPTYKTDVNGHKVRPRAGGNADGKGGKGDVGELGGYQRRVGEAAREYQEIARREALDGARDLVQSKRYSSRNHDTVDLHGLTTAEAVVIVNEILEEKIWTPDKPLKIITGRGSHSAGNISVLKPAVRKSLEENGWIVGQWDAGLTVRGKMWGMR